MKYTSLQFLKSVLEIPSYTGYEQMMKDYVINFAEKEKISFYEDTKGNLYLTKGSVGQGEFFPCMTAHLDNVQTWQVDYVVQKKLLPLQIDQTSKKTIINCSGGGVGADDKTGIVACLEIIKKVENLKIAFFVEEEIGMLGSSSLDKKWFQDIGYVIGVDSPEQNRASFLSNGLPLMSREFFQLIQPICEKHNVTKFNSEPFTDVFQIRKQLGVTCMNFGSGGYYPHSRMEYVIAEDVDKCIGLCLDLIQFLGMKRFLN